MFHTAHLYCLDTCKAPIAQADPPPEPQPVGYLMDLNGIGTSSEQEVRGSPHAHLLFGQDDSSDSAPKMTRPLPPCYQFIRPSRQCSLTLQEADPGGNAKIELEFGAPFVCIVLNLDEHERG